MNGIGTGQISDDVGTVFFKPGKLIIRLELESGSSTINKQADTAEKASDNSIACDYRECDAMPTNFYQKQLPRRVNVKYRTLHHVLFYNKNWFGLETQMIAI